ncbi:MAG: outer membrane protein assembly factor [Methylococcaceae bacterium]|nr:outer membrane protein assembly factor [Methylococcaceae bacterium]
MISLINKIPLLLSLFLCVPQIFADATISGIEDEAEDNVKIMLSIQKEKCDAPKWKIEGLFENADQEIDQALRALGYYHAAIKKSLAFNKDCWKADFHINPGQRTLVSNVDIDIIGDAKDDPAFSILLQKMPLKQGSPLHHGRYETMKSKIESLALDSGYLQGSFTEKKLLIDKQNNTAQIKLTFDSGKRMVFGDISVQQDVLDDGFVKKYLSIKSGETYTSEQLAKTHNALSQSGYFDSVDIRSDLEHIQGHQVPVTIKLTAKKKAHYGFGVGFDTDIGPLLNASYINRRINRYGHFFTSNVDLSTVLSTAEVDYSIPLDKPMTDLFSFGGGLKREHTDTFNSMSATLSARHKHAYTNGWRQTIFLDYTYEDFTTDSDSGQTLLLVPGGSWLKSVSNDPLRPTEGYRVEFEVKGSYENPISDVSFLQGYLSAIWLHELPLGGKFIGRTLQGVTLVDQVTQLPTSYRFYAGGINSVRGYNYKELGPKDSSNNVEGGELLSVISAEYEQAVLENWGVAAFVDTGNAFNFDSIDFKTGVGLGVRWYSPVGPIRLDFALPLNESDSSFQIHFAAGGRL